MAWRERPMHGEESANGGARWVSPSARGAAPGQSRAAAGLADCVARSFAPCIVLNASRRRGRAPTPPPRPPPLAPRSSSSPPTTPPPTSHQSPATSRAPATSSRQRAACDRASPGERAAGAGIRAASWAEIRTTVQNRCNGVKAQGVCVRPCVCVCACVCVCVCVPAGSTTDGS